MDLDFHLVKDCSNLWVLSCPLGIQFPPSLMPMPSSNSSDNSDNLDSILQGINPSNLEKQGSLKNKEKKTNIPRTSCHKKKELPTASKTSIVDNPKGETSQREANISTGGTLSVWE